MFSEFFFVRLAILIPLFLITFFAIFFIVKKSTKISRKKAVIRSAAIWCFILFIAALLLSDNILVENDVKQFSTVDEVFLYDTGRTQYSSVIDGINSCAVLYQTDSFDSTWHYFYKNDEGYKLMKNSDREIGLFYVIGKTSDGDAVQLTVDHIKNTNDYYIWGKVKTSTKVSFKSKEGEIIEPLSEYNRASIASNLHFVFICINSENSEFNVFFDDNKAESMK